MKNIGNVLAFEYIGYLKNKAFRVTTIIFLAVIIIASFIPQIISVIESAGDGDKEKSKAAIVLTGDGTSYEKYINTDSVGEAEPDYVWTIFVAKDTTPTELVNDKDYEIVFEYSGGDSYKLYGSGYDFSLIEMTAVFDSFMTQIKQRVIYDGLNESQAAAVEEVLGVSIRGEFVAISKDGKGGADAMQNFILAYVLLYVLFMVIMMYGQLVVNSVAVEKSTKTMELLVTSAKPTHLMFGKVLGVGLAALTQLAIIFGAAVIGITANISSWSKDVPAAGEMLKSLKFTPGFVIIFILFFILGYFLYTFIYAALGSTVSRIEDAGTIITIPMILMVVAFVISIISMNDIAAAYVKVLSFIPFFTPFVMFGRYAMGEAGLLDVSIGLAILLATVFLMGWLAARIYRLGVMMYGQPMNPISVFKLAFKK
jgi:ABC-2 type transport system permease protein